MMYTEYYRQLAFECPEIYSTRSPVGNQKQAMFDLGEQARGVLPQNMYTEYYGTVNLNNLLKFIDLRTHEGTMGAFTWLRLAWGHRLSTPIDTYSTHTINTEKRVLEACLEIATDLFPETVGAYRRIRNEE